MFPSLLSLGNSAGVLLPWIRNVTEAIAAGNEGVGASLRSDT